MDNSWIKLYRKSKLNEIMRDTVAWTLFTWILMSVDKETGKMRTGRYLLAESLGQTPSTIRNALQRLEKKHRVIWTTSGTASRTGIATEITVSGWDKYQSTEDVRTTNRTASRTEEGQAEDTYTRRENKERDIEKEKTLSPEPRIGKQDKPENHRAFLVSIPEKNIAALVAEFRVTPEQVRQKGKDLEYYCRAHGKKYKDYMAFLENAVKKDFGVRTEQNWSYT